MSLRIVRPLQRQDLITIPFLVDVTAKPIAPNFRPEELITTITVSIPSAGPSCWFGGAGVTSSAGNNPGLEIIPGGLVSFRIENQDQQYDVQAPLLDIDQAATCRQPAPEVIPFIVWDCGTVYLVSTVPTTVVLGLFKTMWI